MVRNHGFSAPCRAPLLDRSSVYYYTDYVVGEPKKLLLQNQPLDAQLFHTVSVFVLEAVYSKAIMSGWSLDSECYLLILNNSNVVLARGFCAGKTKEFFFPYLAVHAFCLGAVWAWKPANPWPCLERCFLWTMLLSLKRWQRTCHDCFFADAPHTPHLSYVLSWFHLIAKSKMTWRRTNCEAVLDLPVHFLRSQTIR